MFKIGDIVDVYNFRNEIIYTEKIWDILHIGSERYDGSYINCINITYKGQIAFRDSSSVKLSFKCKPKSNEAIQEDSYLYTKKKNLITYTKFPYKIKHTTNFNILKYKAREILL